MGELTEDYDSSSCASLNSVNTPIIRPLHSMELSIPESKANIIDITPIKLDCDESLSLKLSTPARKIKKRKTQKPEKHKSKHHKTRRNSKDCSDITTISRLTAK